MQKTLYEINQDYLRLMSEIEENEGEMTPELEQALAINEADHAAKLEAYGQIIANYKAEAEACKAEAARLKAKADRATRSAERLKDTIRFFLTATDRRKVAAGVWSFSLRESVAVEVSDMEILPEGYIREKVTREPDKAALKDALNGGAVIPGAELVTRTSLQIK